MSLFLNKKAFTMVELIIVVIIIGVIVAFAIPNILQQMEKNKKSSMFIDAEHFVELTKNCIVANRKISATERCTYPDFGSKTYYLEQIDPNNTLKSPSSSSDGSVTYKRTGSTGTGSYVKITLLSIGSNSNEYKYYVVLRDTAGNICKMYYGDSKCEE